jgi:hypothetical protein
MMPRHLSFCFCLSSISTSTKKNSQHFWGFRMDMRGLRFHIFKNIDGCLDDLAFDD